MITYLLESGLSLLVLLGMYRLLLENQPMHVLKRAYLLGTLVVSLAAPLIRIDMPPITLPVLGALSSQSMDRQLLMVTGKTHQQPAEKAVPTPVAIPPNPLTVWRWLYATGTLLMLIRFGRNLYRLVRIIRENPTQPFRGAVLVQLPGDELPYTFLHYLFVPNAPYQRGEIEGELFTHELAHVRQRHSLDILLMELVLCFGWFNPLLYWLKQAMKLNHEWLADDAVNRAHHNITGYQELLLNKLTGPFSAISLTSTLTFQTTKQRLTMMTKHASPVRTWLVAGATVLLFATMTVLLSTRTVAQQAPVAPVQKTGTKTQPVQTDVAEMERLYGEKMVSVSPARSDAPLRERTKKFKDLTPEEKTRVVVLKPTARKTPTEAEWTDFKNTKKYGIWVDGKRRRDNPMSKYERTDVVAYQYSFVHKNARQPEGYLYQLNLETEQGYQQTIRDWQEKPWLHLVTKERLEKWHKAHPGK